MQKPLFSVIIPTLNEEKFLPHLLESLRGQTDQDFEVIISDGPSKDKTRQVATSYAKKLPLKIVTSAKGRLPLQRNLGARLAQGEWLAFVDADSILLPNFVSRSRQFISEKKPQLFTTWFRPDSENPKEAIITLFDNMIMEGSISFKKPITVGPLTIVSRAAYDRVGGYDITHAFNEDIDFGQRLGLAGIHLAILRETLCVLSLRRFRKEGMLKVVNQYIISALPILLMNKSFKHMPGYTMGGHLYNKKKINKNSILIKINKLLKELFE